MHDGANEPVAVPVPAREAAGPAAGRRGTLLLLIMGGAVGLALGILLTIGVYSTYTFFTDTIPSTSASVQAFNELNELRQQLNLLNEERKLKEQEKQETMRQALSAVTSTVRTPDSETPSVVPPAPKPGGSADSPAVEKSRDPFADVDAELARLEHTQKVLNMMLDMLSPKAKERVKDR
jgi:hypothetical protein